MFKSKYSTILTVALIILIIAILVIATILSINAYKNYKEEKERKKVISDLQDGDEYYKNTSGNKTGEDENFTIQPITPGDENNIEQGGQSGSSRPRTRLYKGFPMIGSIKIEKTNVEYPILVDVSPSALETAVGVMYPSNPKLNQPGNTVIIGHNYRNGKFFSNNKNLVIGDKIKITDLTGTTLEYTIYEISTLPEAETEYITRERGDNIEISISTCTDDGKARLVILAKVE